MIKLRNMFAGIVYRDDVAPTVDRLKLAGISDSEFMILDKDTASMEINDKNNNLSFSGRFTRAAQRFFGGGPLGFFRDIEKMKPTSKVLVVNSKNLSEKTFERCENIFKKSKMLRKSKHFGRFATEHYKTGTYMY